MALLVALLVRGVISNPIINVTSITSELRPIDLESLAEYKIYPKVTAISLSSNFGACV